MKQALGAVIAVVLGAGLAAAAQAQGTAQQSTTAPTTTMQSAAPAPTTQNPTPATGMQGTGPAANEQGMQTGTRTHRHAALGRHRGERARIMAEQRQLKQEGLYNGRIDGIMGPKTRMAISRAGKTERTASINRGKMNRTASINRIKMSRTAALHRSRLNRQMGGQTTTGFGSSVPRGQNNVNAQIAPAAGSLQQTPSTTGSTMQKQQSGQAGRY